MSGYNITTNPPNFSDRAVYAKTAPNFNANTISLNDLQINDWSIQDNSDVLNFRYKNQIVYSLNNPTVFGSVTGASNPIWVTIGSTGPWVSSEDNYATTAALQCMASGGNAFDAAVTAMAVLGLTRPGNCGLGGGGYATVYHADTQRVDCFDFRETAPLKIDPYCFSTGPLYSQYSAVFSTRRQQGFSVGVPGTPAFMKEVLERYGKYSLSQCFYPAIDLATNGFKIDSSYYGMVNQQASVLNNYTTSRNFFLDPATNYTGSFAVGTVIKNLDYANSLNSIAQTNTKSFYFGPIGQAIVNVVNNPPKQPNATVPITGGNMTMEDLALYQVRTSVPLKIPFRNTFVYTVPPSTSGGLLIAQTLMMYQALYPTVSYTEAGLADSYFARIMALRYAFADRNAYVADPMFFPTPTQGMIDPVYLASRAASIPSVYPSTTSPFGNPPNYYAYGATGTVLLSTGPSSDPTATAGSTTGLIIGDAYGNVVSIVFTIEQIFGNGCMVPGCGFVLNNELTDFNQQQYGVLPTANSPQPGKRPRSSTAPTLVFRNSKPIIAASSAGGANIPSTILNGIVDVIDYNYSVQNLLLEGRYFESNSSTISTDSQATAQKFNSKSAYTLLTNYKGIATSRFAFAATGASPNTTIQFGVITPDPIKPWSGVQIGSNWPEAVNTIRWGSAKSNTPISTFTNGTWTPPL